MNEWILVKGCILGIWIDEPCVVITTSVETLDRLWLYCYTGCVLRKAPRIKETLHYFCENMNPDKNGTQQCDIRSPEIHMNSAG